MQQAKIERALQFVGDGQNKDNVEGNPSCTKLVGYDDFNQLTIDATSDYTVTLGGLNDTFTISVTPGSGGWVSLVSGDTDDNVMAVATPLIFDITKSPICEARVQISDVSQTSFYFGFGDAVTITTPSSTVDYADATLADAVTDQAGFVCDADKVLVTYPPIYATSSKTGGAVGAAVTGVVWQDGINHILRIELKPDGDAHYFVDGVLTNIRQAAVTDVPLCIIFNAGTRDNGAGDPVYVDYLKYWQDR
jgi:hypothetical protein